MGIFVRSRSAAQAVGSLTTPGGNSTANSSAAFFARDSSFGSAEMTIEMWLRGQVGDNNTNNVTEGTGYVGEATDGHIIWDADDGTNGSCFILGLNQGRPYFGVRAASDATRIATTNIMDGDWHHVAWQRRASDGLIQIYVDGVREEDFDGPNGSVAYPGGGSATDGRHYLWKEKLNITLGYDGDTSEIRGVASLVYSGASFTPPTEPLTAIANTAFLFHMANSGDPMADSSGNDVSVTLIGSPNPTHSDDDPF